MNKQRKNLLLSLSPCLLVLTLTTAASAETLWVKNATVDIRSGKGAVYPSVATAQKGQELNVLAHDGNWVQVQAGSVQGWVFGTALSASKVNGDINIMAPGAATANMSTGIAARGLQPSAEQYVSSRGMNKSALEYLISLRKSIQPAEYLAFTSQGNVGSK